MRIPNSIYIMVRLATRQLLVLLLLMTVPFSECKPTFQQINFPQICRKKSDCPNINHECVTLLSGYGYCMNMDIIQVKKPQKGINEMSVENDLLLNPTAEEVFIETEQPNGSKDIIIGSNSSNTVGDIGNNQMKNSDTDTDSHAPVRFTDVRVEARSHQMKRDEDGVFKKEDLAKSFENWNSMDDINLMHIMEINEDEDDGDEDNVLGRQVLFSLLRENYESESIKPEGHEILNDDDDDDDDDEDQFNDDE